MSIPYFKRFNGNRYRLLDKTHKFKKQREFKELRKGIGDEQMHYDPHKPRDHRWPSLAHRRTLLYLHQKQKGMQVLNYNTKSFV